MRISDWSSDVCSSDLSGAPTGSTTWSAGWRPAAGDRAHEHPTMSVIASRLDTRSDAFRANAERTSGLVEELRAKVRAVKEGGGERARERPLGRGKLLPPERVRTLPDPGAAFLEVSQLAADGPYNMEDHPSQIQPTM